jgi:hypothetical protein
MVVWVGFIWLRIETSSGFWEHDKELSGSINCRKFLNG